MVAAHYDKKRKPKSFKEGSKVLLSSRHIQLARPNQKLADKLLGPFLIEEKVGRNVYRLKLLPKYNRLYLIFYISLLKEYH